MNQRGQALIEMLILSSITIVSVLMIVRLGFILQLNIAIDEMIESAHLCDLQNQKDCAYQLSTKMKSIGLIEKSLSLSHTTNKSMIQLQAETSLGHSFRKESELELALSVP